MSSGLTLLTRRGCHLCDLVRGPISSLASELGLPLRELDIDEDLDLRAVYDLRVPVLLVGQQVLAEGRIDPGGLPRLLGDANAS